MNVIAFSQGRALGAQMPFVAADQSAFLAAGLTPLAQNNPPAKMGAFEHASLPITPLYLSTLGQRLPNTVWLASGRSPMEPQRAGSKTPPAPPSGGNGGGDDDKKRKARRRDAKLPERLCPLLSSLSDAAQRALYFFNNRLDYNDTISLINSLSFIETAHPGIRNLFLESITLLSNSGIRRGDESIVEHAVAIAKDPSENKRYGWVHEIIRIADLIRAGEEINNIGKDISASKTEGISYYRWFFNTATMQIHELRTRRTREAIDADAYSGATKTVYEIKSMQNGLNVDVIRLLIKIQRSSTKSGIDVQPGEGDAANKAVTVINQIKKLAAALQAGLIDAVEYHITSPNALDDTLIELLQENIPNVRIFRYDNLTTPRGNADEIPASTAFRWEPCNYSETNRFRRTGAKSSAHESDPSAEESTREMWLNFFGEEFPPEVYITTSKVPQTLSRKAREVSANFERSLNDIRDKGTYIIERTDRLVGFIENLRERIKTVKKIRCRLDERRTYVTEIFDINSGLNKLNDLIATWDAAAKALNTARESSTSQEDIPSSPADYSDVASALNNIDENGNGIDDLVESLKLLTLELQRDVSESIADDNKGSTGTTDQTAKTEPTTHELESARDTNVLKELIDDIWAKQISLSNEKPHLESYTTFTKTVENLLKQLSKNIPRPEENQIEQWLTDIADIDMILTKIFKINELINEHAELQDEIDAGSGSDDKLASIYSDLNSLNILDIDKGKIATTTKMLNDVLNELESIIEELTSPRKDKKNIAARQIVKGYIYSYPLLKDTFDALIIKDDHGAPLNSLEEIIDAFTTWVIECAPEEDLSKITDDEITDHNPDSIIAGLITDIMLQLFDKWGGTDPEALKITNRPEVSTHDQRPWANIDGKRVKRKINALLHAAPPSDRTHTPSKGFKDWTKSTREVSSFQMSSVIKTIMDKLSKVKGPPELKEHATELSRELNDFKNEFMGAGGPGAYFNIGRLRNSLFELFRRYIWIID